MADQKELLNKYNRIANDKKQLESFAKDVIEGNIGGGGSGEIKVIELNDYFDISQLAMLVQNCTGAASSYPLEESMVSDKEFDIDWEKDNDIKLRITLPGDTEEESVIVETIAHKSANLGFNTNPALMKAYAGIISFKQSGDNQINSIIGIGTNSEGFKFNVLMYNCEKPVEQAVVANPELAIPELLLNSLQIGNTAYKINNTELSFEAKSAGAGYRTFNATDSNNNLIFSLSIQKECEISLSYDDLGFVGDVVYIKRKANTLAFIQALDIIYTNLGSGNVDMNNYVLNGSLRLPSFTDSNGYSTHYSISGTMGIACTNYPNSYLILKSPIFLADDTLGEIGIMIQSFTDPDAQAYTYIVVPFGLSNEDGQALFTAMAQDSNKKIRLAFNLYRFPTRVY